MAQVEIEIASRKYVLACRDGEEAHLQSVAALVDKRARDAGAALGTMGEARQLLFASLMLADDIKELKAGNAPAAPVEEPNSAFAEAAEAIAERIEALADRLEAQMEPARGLEEPAANA